jgi:serine/threonine protein kinase
VLQLAGAAAKMRLRGRLEVAMRWWQQLEAPLLGRYRVEGRIGAGAMAEVLLAHDERFAGKKVAIKSPNFDDIEPNQLQDMLARFQREVQRQGSEPIVGVVPIFDAGEIVDAQGKPHPFLVMDYLSGGSLGERLGGIPGQREQRQTLAEVLGWLRPIAATLDRLHARMYLHRDVKPDNILFNAEGDPFLADFGIATALQRMGANDTLVSVMGGTGPGSPGYQSPESLRGEKSAASDQFSLAVVVFETLTGRLPMATTTREGWIAALANWKPTPITELLPTLPAAAADTIMRALSAEARERYANCTEFAAALERAMHAPAAGAPPSTPSRVTPPPTAKGAGWSMRKTAVTGLFLALLVAAGVLAVMLFDTTRELDTSVAQTSAEPSAPDRAPAPIDANQEHAGSLANPSAPVLDSGPSAATAAEAARLSQAMAVAKAAEEKLRARPLPPRTTVVVQAADFIQPLNVALGGRNNMYGADVLLNGPPYADVPNAATWRVIVARGGVYVFKAEYAAEESRPVRILINGKLVFSSALAAPTGCWTSNCQATLIQGNVRLRDGLNILRVERASYFPHIRSFVFEPVER